MTAFAISRSSNMASAFNANVRKIHSPLVVSSADAYRSLTTLEEVLQYGGAQ